MNKLKSIAIAIVTHLPVSLIVSLCTCGKFLGIKRGYGVYGISHGLCRGCYEREIAKVRG
jgi:hypothetical protein